MCVRERERETGRAESERERERERERDSVAQGRGSSGPYLSQDGITSGSDRCTLCWVAMQEGTDLFLPPTSALSLLPF